MKFVIVAFFLMFLNGCAWSGTKIETSFVENIKDGITTEQEIRQELGEPYKTSVPYKGNRKLVYTYAFAHAKGTAVLCEALGGETCFKDSRGTNVTKAQLLEVWVNEAGIVIKHNFVDR